MYACVVRDKRSGGRCQNPAVNIGGQMIFCRECLEGESVKPAPEPTHVLVRLHGGKSLLKALEKTGIPPKPRDQSLLDGRNRLEASRVGRDPGRFGGEHPVTGCAVFGMDGVQGVAGITGLVDEIRAVKYCASDIHWVKEEKKLQGGRQTYDAATLIMGLSKSEEIIPDEFTPLLEMFSILKEERWGVAKVFANPPKESGEVVHALELYQRGSGDGTSNLHFLEGLWGLEIKEREPVYNEHRGPLTQRLGDLMPK